MKKQLKTAFVATLPVLTGYLVLGFGFGAVKGVIIVVMGFSVLVLGYDTVWGPAGRPDWIKGARTYQLVNAASAEMVQLIDERRRQLHAEQSGDAA